MHSCTRCCSQRGLQRRAGCQVRTRGVVAFSPRYKRQCTRWIAGLPLRCLLIYPSAKLRRESAPAALAQPGRMMRRVCFLALCVAARATPSGAQLDDLGAPLLTIPLHKGGEEYALLDFFSADPAHIETTAHQFCSDHSFSAADKAMIIEHATKQMAMVQSQRAQLPQVNGVSGQGPVPPNKPSSNVHKLVMFMTENKMSPSDVLRALADTL